MRKLLISFLLASAAASPALAERPEDSDREAARAERQQARDDRQSAREERSAPVQHEQASRPDRPAPRSVAPQVVERRTVERTSQPNANGAAARNAEAFRARQQAVQDERQDRVEQRAERLQQVRYNRELRQSTRPLPNVLHTRVPIVSNVPRPGTQPPLRIEQNHAPIQWSSNWRNNSRYDWKSHRHHHHSLFHLGLYYDPFGWGYQPYSIGWRMWPSYYRSNYWLNDPWQYRLPYAPPGTRWIRYYDDAILIDMWSGQVVDVIYNFFW